MGCHWLTNCHRLFIEVGSWKLQAYKEDAGNGNRGGAANRQRMLGTRQDIVCWDLVID